MKTFLLNTIYFITILFSITLFSQEIANNKTIPTSIYSFENTLSNFNDKFNLNNGLNFEQYQFIYLNKQAIEDGYFAIPLNNIGLKPSSYVYETYNDIYNTRRLNSSFFKVSKLYNNPDARKKANDFVNKRKQNTKF